MLGSTGDPGLHGGGAGGSTEVASPEVTPCEHSHQTAPAGASDTQRVTPQV